MDNLDLARCQFAITTMYHFLFVPLTVGLAYLIAFMHTKYVVKNDEEYKKMAKFWGKLFLLNFAVGVVNRIMQEFQFGMNWSAFSATCSAAPRERSARILFPRVDFSGSLDFRLGAVAEEGASVVIWLVAIGTTLPALWILTANSFNNGRARCLCFVCRYSRPS